MTVFCYENKKDTCTITGIKKEGGKEEQEVLILPTFFKECPVKALANYAFKEQRQLKEVSLPEYLEKIGDHTFYNCRNLEKISFYDNICVVGDGAFKNCERLRSLFFTVKKNRMTALKGVLSEINKELTVTINKQQEQQTVLIFPTYLYDYEENNEARIINQITYGCGLHYRECVRETGIDYREYDKLFEKACVLDIGDSVFKIAAYRLCYPISLTAERKKVYWSYLKENQNTLFAKFCKEEKKEEIKLLIECKAAEENEFFKWIDIAAKMGQMELVNFLLQEKRKRFVKKERNYIL